MSLIQQNRFEPFPGPQEFPQGLLLSIAKQRVTGPGLTLTLIDAKNSSDGLYELAAARKPCFWTDQVLPALMVDARRFADVDLRAAASSIANHYRYPKEPGSFVLRTSGDLRELIAIHGFVAKVEGRSKTLFPFVDRAVPLLQSPLSESGSVFVERLPTDRNQLPIAAVIESIPIVQIDGKPTFRRSQMRTVFDLQAFPALLNNAEYVMNQATVRSLIIHKYMRALINDFNQKVTPAIHRDLVRRGLVRTDELDLLNAKILARAQHKKCIIDAFKEKRQIADDLLLRAIAAGYYKMHRLEPPRNVKQSDVLCSAIIPVQHKPVTKLSPNWKITDPFEESKCVAGHISVILSDLSSINDPGKLRIDLDGESVDTDTSVS